MLLVLKIGTLLVLHVLRPRLMVTHMSMLPCTHHVGIVMVTGHVGRLMMVCPCTVHAILLLMLLLLLLKMILMHFCVFTLRTDFYNYTS